MMKRALLSTAVVCAALGCSTPVEIIEPVELLTSEYRYACGNWAPSTPPAQRTLFDLRLSQIDTARSPDRTLVNAIEAAGGRIVHVYNGPMVRAALDVAKIPGLVKFGKPVNNAKTVVDPNLTKVSLIAMLDHDLSQVDIEAVEALGAEVTHELHALEGYVAVVDDAKVPQVRALPGVMFAGFDAVGCLASSR